MALLTVIRQFRAIVPAVTAISSLTAVTLWIC